MTAVDFPRGESDDLGFFRAGAPIPDNWITVRPTANDSQWFGAIFTVDTEVTFKDGWLRLHATEPSDTIFRLKCAKHANIHFNYDMKFFDAQGSELGSIVACPGAEWRVG